MKRLVEIFLMCVAGALTSAPAGAAEPAAEPPAEPPTTAEVLHKIHKTNEKEVDMGRMAAEYGNAKDVRSFGKTLVKDHLAIEKKVVKLAKEEKVEKIALADTATAPDDMETLPAGAALDATFARTMLEGHRRDITELEAVRDSTDDAKLKKLLDDILPTLQKHEDTARRLVAQAPRS